MQGNKRGANVYKVLFFIIIILFALGEHKKNGNGKLWKMKNGKPGLVLDCDLILDEKLT